MRLKRILQWGRRVAANAIINTALDTSWTYRWRLSVSQLWEGERESEAGVNPFQGWIFLFIFMTPPGTWGWWWQYSARDPKKSLVEKKPQDFSDNQSEEVLSQPKRPYWHQKAKKGHLVTWLLGLVGQIGNISTFSEETDTGITYKFAKVTKKNEIFFFFKRLNIGYLSETNLLSADEIWVGVSSSVLGMNVYHYGGKYSYEILVLKADCRSCEKQQWLMNQNLHICLREVKWKLWL